MRFRAEVPHLGSRPDFDWIIGEPAGFEFPAGRFDYLIDFATPSAAEVGAGGPAIVERCLQGSANLIRFARTAGVRRVLYASSGAVYGRQPGDVERLGEDFSADAATVSSYGLLKQRSEALFLASNLDCVVTRGFAFIGPYLPLTDKFAAGSFLRDALAGGPIRIHGDGHEVRSYLYAGDLTASLIGLLAHGKCRTAYNVGSDVAVSLIELANLIAALAPGRCEVLLGGKPAVGAERYVPDVIQGRRTLGNRRDLPLAEAIKRTLDWALNAAPPAFSTKPNLIDA